MDKHRWKKIEYILDTAVTLSGDEQTQYIRTACEGDEKLVAEVYDWLEAMEASEQSDFLEDIYQDTDQLTFDLWDSGSSSHEDWIGKTFGSFKITEVLGAGGMGIVLKAERIDGHFTQQVAIKILQKEILSSDTSRRLHLEQEILAGLNHPHIAKLFDGGVTKDGIPFLVMEFIDGIPIDEFCNTHMLTIDERLQLFMDVCSAVQHAHSNLVIHRDLKVQNILVDSDGMVKVLDFGIAKILDPALSEQSLLETRPGEKLWTPQYAAPEQIKGQKLTIATDIYALGILLHKILTDTYPLDLNDKRIGEIERIIRNSDPVKASRSLNQLDDAEEICKMRRLSRSQFTKKIEGDLDAIILKTIRKEPEDRYESVNELRNDIENHLNNRPVQAKRGTIRYRVTKFIRRNRIKFVASVLLLVMTVGFGIYHFYRIDSQRRIAEQEAEKAKEVTSYMVNLFESADPLDNVEDTLNVYDLLARGRERVREMRDQPAVQVDLLLALGNSYQKIGAYEDAEILFRKADSLANTIYSSTSPEIAKISLNLGSLYKTTRDFETASVYYEKAATIYEQFKAEEGLNLSYSLSGLGEVLQEMGQLDSAEVLINRALALNEKYHSKPIDMVNDMLKLAKIYRSQEKYREAEQLYRSVLKQLDQQDEPNYRFLPITLNNLAFLLRLQEKYSEAEKYYRRSLKLHQKIYGLEHAHSVRILGNLASVTFLQDKMGETERLLEHRVELTRNKYGLHWRSGAVVESLGVFYYQSQQFKKAANTFQKSYQIYSEVLGTDHTWSAISYLYRFFSLQNAGMGGNSDISFQKGLDILYSNRSNFSGFDRRKLKSLIDNAVKHSVVNLRAETRKLEKLLPGE